MANEILGLIGKKIGMTQLFDKNAASRGVTIIELTPNTVLQVKTASTKDGYNAVQLAWGTRKDARATRAELGHFKKAGAATAAVVREFRVTAEVAAGLEAGKQLVLADFFKEGQRVDVQGVSKGKGFAGVMKRHGFHGLRATHGVQRKHRSPGSIGGCSTPGRVFKGMKMAGRMGGERQTTLNLRIQGVDLERGLILVKGAIPGPKGGLVFVRDDGRPMQPWWVTRHFTHVAAAAGLPQIRLHDLRHSSATLGLAAGESLTEVSARLGHAGIAITADIYAGVLPESARRSTQRRVALMTGTRQEGTHVA